MNPFDLPGPQFLGFYLLFSAAVLAGMHWLRRVQEGGPAPMVVLDDPYLVAYLNGGRDQSAAVAAASLIDRGLLKLEGSVLTAGREDAEELARRPLEKALVKRVKEGGDVTAVLQRGYFLDEPCKAYAESLQQLGALPDEEVERARWRRFFLTAGLLGGVALIKVAVALSRGRSNISFLILLAALACWVAYRIGFPFRTARGDALSADLKTLYASLKERADSIQSGGASNELAWLGAVFGLAAVPLTLFPLADELLSRQARGSSADSTGSSCASTSSCSSSSCSSGSSCGSSCGGGGGGCGGCGS
jgi:uncharacterized protein (TIGR04222 family)